MSSLAFLLGPAGRPLTPGCPRPSPVTKREDSALACNSSTLEAEDWVQGRPDLLSKSLVSQSYLGPRRVYEMWWLHACHPPPNMGGCTSRIVSLKPVHTTWEDPIWGREETKEKGERGGRKEEERSERGIMAFSFDLSCLLSQSATESSRSNAAGFWI